MAMNVGELVAYLQLDDSKYRKTLDAANKGALAFGSTVAKAGAGIMALGSGVQVIGGLAGVLGTAAGALPVLVAGAAAAKFGMVALSLATEGFGEAMSSMEDPAAFAEAIKDLAPAAQETALAVRGLKPAWDEMKTSLQGKLFENLAPVVRDLGGKYMPILGDGFGRVATAANGAARDVGEMMSNTDRVGRAQSMVSNFAAVWEELLPAVGQVGVALFDSLSVASDFLPGLVSGATDAAQAFSLWAESAEGQARIRDLISDGLDALGKLGQVAGNVGEILGGIFRAADQGGAPFLERLVAITQQIADMVNSADGQEALGTFFSTAATLSGLFMQALQALLPVLPPLVEVLGTLAVNIGTMLVTALTAIAPYLEAFAGFLSENPGLVMGAAIALGVLVGALNGLMAIAKVVGIVQTIMASGFLGMAASAIGTAATWIGSWLAMAAGSVASAAMMAASWLLSIWPIALVIAAIAGLVALVVIYWDEIVAFTTAAWDAVVGFITEAGANIVATVDGWATAVGDFIRACWDGAVQWTQNAWSNLTGAVQSGISATVSWVAGLPGQILGIILGLGRSLAQSGRAIVDDFLGGIQAGWNKLMGWVQSGMDMLRGLWPFSPAKWGPFSGAGYVTHSGKALTGDFAQSMRAGMPGVIASARDLMAAAHLELGPASATYAPSVPAPRGPEDGSTDAGTGGRPVVSIEINNPLAERSSDALGRAGSVLAAVGPWGDE